LREFEYSFVRQIGSHRSYTKPGNIRPLVIPVHNKDIAVSIIKSNMRSAGMDRETYFRLLKKCR